MKFKILSLALLTAASQAAVVLEYTTAGITDNAGAADVWAPTTNTTTLGDTTFNPTGTLTAGGYTGAVDSDAAATSSYASLFNGNDFTMSVSFTLADLTGNHVLFESGGFTTGVGLWVEGDTARLTIKNGGATLVDLSGGTLVAGTLYTLSASVDFDGTGPHTTGLFLDGALLDSDATLTETTIFGGNVTTFNNTSNSAVPGGTALAVDNGIAFSGFKVEDTATAIPEPSSFLLGALGSLVLLSRRGRA